MILAPQLALVALLRNKMRSLLTTLGIVIGVAAVIAMQSMGEGATAYIGESISGLGSNMLMAMPGASQHGMGRMVLGVPLFTTHIVETLRHEAKGLSLVAAANSRPGMRVVYGAENRVTNVGGVTPATLVTRLLPP